MPQIIDYSAKGCQPSEAWKDINCLCILRILSSVCDFTYLTLLLLLKSWQAQSRASRLATYPSGSSPIFPFSCQETWWGVNHSCTAAVASRRYQENVSSGRAAGPPIRPVSQPSTSPTDYTTGGFALGTGEEGNGKKWPRYWGSLRSPWKVSCKYITWKCQFWKLPQIEVRFSLLTRSKKADECPLSDRGGEKRKGIQCNSEEYHFLSVEQTSGFWHLLL